MAGNGKSEPIFGLPGTLVAKDRGRFFSETKCSASVRSRKQWGNDRGLVVSGPLDKIANALEMVKECMKANVDKDIPKGNGHATGTWERREAAQKRKAHNDMKPHSTKSKTYNCSSSSWQQA